MATRRDTQTPREVFRAITSNNYIDYTVVHSYIDNGGDPNVDLTSFVTAAVSGSYGDDAIVGSIKGSIDRDCLTAGHLSLLHLAVFNLYRKRGTVSTVTKIIGAGADTSVAVVNIRLCGLFSRHTPLQVNKAVTPRDLAVILEPYQRAGSNVMGLVIELLGDAERKAPRKDRCDAYNTLATSNSVPVHKSVPKTLKTLLFSEKFSDVQFKCQDGTTFHAHKNILAAASPYFSTAFEGPWGEQHQDGLWETSNSPAVMKAVLSFIYIGEITSDVMDHQAADMLTVASEYSLPGLWEICEASSADSLSVDNVKIMLQLAKLHDSSLLKRSCLKFCKKKMATVLTNPSVLSLAVEDAELWAEVVAAISPDNGEQPSKKRGRLSL
jgi:hypothetical protein